MVRAAKRSAERPADVDGVSSVPKPDRKAKRVKKTAVSKESTTEESVVGSATVATLVPQGYVVPTLTVSTERGLNARYPGSVLRRLYRVPRKLLTESEVESHVHALTRVPLCGGNAFADDNPEPIRSYRLDTEWLTVPRFYGEAHFGVADVIEMPPAIPARELEAKYPCLLPFRTDVPQEETVLQTIDELQKNGGTVLSIPCGHGKTFSAIYIAAHLGPALIVTDQIAILDGWRADIKKFLGDNVPIGLIHGKTFDVEGKFIVLAMLQTLSARRLSFNPASFQRFRLCVVDEVHVACARTFSQVLPLISTRYMLGLSATPTRTDRMECMLEWFFRGVNVGYQLEKQPIELDFIRNETYIKPRFVKRNGEKVLLRHLLLEHLIERNEARTNQAVQRIVDEVPRGHHVIVFSETLLGVEAVYNKLLEARDVHGVLPADCTVGMFRAGMKKVDRARVQQCRIIVATYKMCEKGFNVPRLSMAVLLTPRPGKALQQIIGRITRICPGKPTPLVIDFIDLQPGSVRPANATGTMYPELAGLFYSRMRHYKGGMYECRTLSAPNDMPAEETAAVATVPATETAFKVVSKRNEFIQLSDAE